MTAQSKCPICDDDGYVETWDPDDMTIVATHECPRLDDPGHAPFNATGVLDPLATREDAEWSSDAADQKAARK